MCNVNFYFSAIVAYLLPFSFQALLDYIKSDLDMSVYWKTLNSNGVTKERLKSYDRPIVSEPRFRPDQKEGLIRDLTAYLQTLKVFRFSFSFSFWDCVVSAPKSLIYGGSYM